MPRAAWVLCWRQAGTCMPGLRARSCPDVCMLGWSRPAACVPRARLLAWSDLAAERLSTCLWACGLQHARAARALHACCREEAAAAAAVALAPAASAACLFCFVTMCQPPAAQTVCVSEQTCAHTTCLWSCTACLRACGVHHGRSERCSCRRPDVFVGPDAPPLSCQLVLRLW